MERVNEESPKEFESTGNNVDDTIGNDRNLDNNDQKDKPNLINKLVDFFKGSGEDKIDSDLPKNDNLNENWENRNVDYEDQVTPRNTGNFITKKAEETGNFLKKEAEKITNVVRKKLDLEDKPPSNFSDNNKTEDLTINLSNNDGKDVSTKIENWISDKFEKKTDANWTQRYVDYDKQDVTPRDISNDYIKDEMVGNVRGVYLKTRTLESTDLTDNSTTSNWDQTKDNLTNTWDKTKDNLSNTWDKTKDNVSNTWDKTKDNATITWDKTKDNVANTWDKTKDNVTNTWDKAKDNVANTWDKTKDNVANTWDKTKDNLAGVRDNLTNTLDQNKDLTSSRSEDVAGFVDPNKNEMEPRNIV